MNFKNTILLIRNNLPQHPAIKFISIIAALLYVLLGALFAFIFKDSVFLLFAMGGVINSAFIEIRALEFHFFHRNLLVCTINTASVFTFILGCMSAGSIVFSITGIVIASLILAETGDANKVIGTFAFVFSLMFILGLNMHTNFTRALCNGAALILGGFLMTFLSILFFSLTKIPHTDNLKRHLFDKSWFPLTGKKFRYFLWLALSSSIAYAIAELLRIPNSFWAPMTVFIVMRFNVGSSYALIWHRLAGTVLGVGLSAPIVIFIHNAAILLLIILAIMILTIIFATGKYYGIYVCLLTMMTIIGFACLQNKGIITMESRLADTFIGVAISAIVIYFLAPFFLKLINSKILKFY